MNKNGFKVSNILFLLLVPVVVIMYIVKVIKGKNLVVANNDVIEEEKGFVPQGLNDRQVKIVDYMRRNGGCGKVSDMVSLFSATDRTLRRDLNKLEGLGVVKRSGSTKSVSYSLSK